MFITAKKINKPTINNPYIRYVLIFFSPLFIGVYLLLMLSQNSAFFTQDRPGKNGKVFKLIKFKTMSDKRDAQGNLLWDHCVSLHDMKEPKLIQKIKTSIVVLTLHIILFVSASIIIIKKKDILS